MKALKWSCIILGSLVAVIAITAYAFLSSDYLSERLSAAVGTHIGRKFSVDGPLRIAWDWHSPRIHAEGLRIANAAGISPENMVEIQQVDFSIKIWQLLRGRLELPEIALKQPQIYLSKIDETHNNWDFPALSGANIAKKTVTPSSRGNMPVIDSLRIEQGKLVFEDKPRNLNMDLNVDTVKANNDPHERFSFKGTGTIDGKTFDITADGGSLELLRDTKKPFPLALTLAIGTTKFSINGTFTDPVRLKGLDAPLHLSGNNLADLFYLLHVPLPPTPRYDLQGHLVKEGKQWTFSPFNGRVGGSDLEGNVVYDTSGKLPLLKGNLRSKKLDVKDLGGFIGMDPAKQTKITKGDKLLPDTPLNLNRLRNGNMDLTLTAQKLIAPGWPLNDMDTHIKLTNGLLEMKPLNFGIADGKAEGYIVIDGQKDVPAAQIDMAFQNLRLKPFFDNEKFGGLSDGVFDARTKLAGNGASMAQILGDSNGRIAVVLPSGKISLLLVRAADLDVKMIPLLVGKDKTTNIRCGAGDFAVNNGVLNSQIFVLDTEASNIQGKAQIDLKDEDINAAIDARSKDPSLIALQSKILIKGHLSDPHVMIDPLSTGVRGAAAVALGALAPVVAFLPFIEPGMGKDSNCSALLSSVAPDAIEPAAGGKRIHSK